MSSTFLNFSRRNEPKLTNDVDLLAANLFAETLDVFHHFVGAGVLAGIMMTRNDVDVWIAKSFWLDFSVADIKPVPDEMVGVERLDVRGDLFGP